MKQQHQKKDPDAPSSSRQRKRAPRGKQASGPFKCGPLRPEDEVDIKSVINNQQMLVFQGHLENWVKENATDAEGNQWSQRAIAEKLGIVQPVLGAWIADKGRPGIVQLIYLRKKFRVPIERMLGLPPLRV